jgi:hypothetical protein
MWLVDAEKEHRLALAIREKLAADFPAVPEYRKELAITHHSLGIVLYAQPKLAEAVEQHRQEVAIWEKLAADFPAVPEYREGLARAHHMLGISLAAQGEWAEAVEQYRQEEAILEKLAADFPAVPEYRIDLGKSYVSRAKTKLWAGQVAEAVAEVAELTAPGANETGLANWNANQLYSFACVCAVASDKLADKKAEYADRAMELLQKAVKAGYKDAAHMIKDTDLDPLRGRDDFKNLLAELEKKAEKK